MRVTLAQLGPELGDIDANIERVERVVAEATGESSDLIVFPELYLSGYSVGDVDRDLSIRPDDERIRKLAAQADDAGLLVTFMESGSRGLHTYNSAVYYENGELLHVHRKLYLPTYGNFEERKHFTPGQSLRSFAVMRDHRAAVLICNDAWQPPLPFVATQDGARLLLIPSASAQSMFPERYDSRGYWRGITRFYARMFQLFVVFVNRVGVEGDLRFWGGSHVVDPWGEVIAEAAEEREHLLTVDIDLADVRRRRRDVPLVKEARLGLVRREVERLLDEGGDL